MEIRRWRGMFEKMAVGLKDGGGFERRKAVGLKKE